MPLPEPLRMSEGTPLSLKPLEQLQLPPEFDGGRGTNRALGTRPQIAAHNDVDAIRAWLARFVDTKATFDTYRKESERLVLWSTTELRKPLSSLTHEDLMIYRQFLADPQPAQRWVMTGRKVARTDPSWRPLAGPLSPSGERQAFVILNTLFAWLVNAGLSFVKRSHEYGVRGAVERKAGLSMGARRVTREFRSFGLGLLGCRMPLIDPQGTVNFLRNGRSASSFPPTYRR